MPKPPTPHTAQGRGGHRWGILRAQIYREETHCWICGQPVDQTLPTNHPMARSVDHIHPLGMGGHPLDRTNCRLAHRCCNVARSNKLRAKPKDRGRISIDPATI